MYASYTILLRGVGGGGGLGVCNCGWHGSLIIIIIILIIIEKRRRKCFI